MILKNKLEKLGIHLENQTGHLSYSSSFQPIKLSAELVLIRHGETYGNCGQSTENAEIDYEKVNAGTKDRNKRIFQGQCDYEINQLTTLGKEQANQIALELEEKLLAKGWLPDLILHSPLSRAKDTGFPFVKRNGLENRYQPNAEIREMSYGVLENRRICDISSSDSCHELYRNQNTLVKESGINRYGKYQEAECFSEVILRAYDFFTQLDQAFTKKKMILFTHSMFGAACMILFGRGQKAEDADYLAFDGKRKNGTSYTLPYAMPIVLF